MMAYASANRDEDVWDRPDEFDVTRSFDKDHQSFGYGEHSCPGALLARTDSTVIFERLLARFPDWELAGAPQRWANPFLQGLGTPAGEVPRDEGRRRASLRWRRPHGRACRSRPCCTSGGLRTRRRRRPRDGDLVDEPRKSPCVAPTSVDTTAARACARRPRSRSKAGGPKAGLIETGRLTETRRQMLADRLAVTDVVVRYFELVDAKGWEHMHEVFTEDTTARWTPDSLVEGRDSIVGAMQHMIGSDEIVTFHHVASMAPVVDGDTAEVVGARSCDALRRRSAGGEVLREPRHPADPFGADAGGLADQPPRVADRGEARGHGRAVRAGDRRG